MSPLRDMPALEILGSWFVDPGVKTQRVKRVRRWRRWRRRPADVPARGRKAWRRDPTVAGKGAVTRCISMPREDWNALDAAAKRLGISRSEYLRRAAKHLRSTGDGTGATTAMNTSTSSATPGATTRDDHHKRRKGP